MIGFGISHLPPDDGDDAAFVDGLVDRGHSALELPFTKGFPWKESRCRAFSELAAERGIRLSALAPYFAGLTVREEDRAGRSLAALEHTMKLGEALGAPIVVAHLGGAHGEDPAVLMDRVRRRLDRVGPKVEGLGVGMGLETAGRRSAFGSLGDIAQLAAEYPFVRPVIDWAHVHAMTGGGLTSREAFAEVLAFAAERFPGWMIHPLHAQFSDNELGPAGEIRHVEYGKATLRVGPLVEAVEEAGMSMTLISEARDAAGHDLIWDEARARLGSGSQAGRRLASAAIDFPSPVRVSEEGDRFRPLGLDRPLTLSSIDKVCFPGDGYTKGDLIQYYAAAAPLLLPHLAGRPLSMSRYPEGVGGPSFFEKRAPGHQPGWMRTTPVESGSMGGVIDFLTADSVEALMWFANMGCVEVHPLHSVEGSLDSPSYAVFDFDPGEGASWEQVTAAAKLLNVALGQLGLTGWPKLSGSKGIHVYVPLAPGHGYDRVRRFVGEVGRHLAAANPADIILERDKAKRKGKVHIDVGRNTAGQTVASAYSVRPLPGAPVSLPLRWDEVGSVANGDYTIANLWGRVQRLGDIFAPVLAGGQSLGDAEELLGAR